MLPFCEQNGREEEGKVLALAGWVRPAAAVRLRSQGAVLAVPSRQFWCRCCQLRHSGDTANADTSDVEQAFAQPCC